MPQSSVYHYNDAIMSTMASQITGNSIVCSTISSDTNQRKHQNSTSLAFVRGIHRWLVDSTHKRPVTWNMLPFDDVIMCGPTPGHPYASIGRYQAISRHKAHYKLLFFQSLCLLINYMVVKYSLEYSNGLFLCAYCSSVGSPIYWWK